MKAPHNPDSPSFRQGVQDALTRLPSCNSFVSSPAFRLIDAIGVTSSFLGELAFCMAMEPGGEKFVARLQEAECVLDDLLAIEEHIFGSQEPATHSNLAIDSNDVAGREARPIECDSCREDRHGTATFRPQPKELPGVEVGMGGTAYMSRRRNNQ